MIMLSCEKKQTIEKVEDNNIVTVEFNSTINGYKVKAYWKPDKVIRMGNSYVTGPAILEFTKIKNNSTFTLTNNHFGLKNINLPFIFNSDSTKIQGLKQKHIKLTYQKDGTFFFKDVNFDNKPELIISEFGKGQRGLSQWRVYEMDDYIDIYCLDSAPYNMLDDSSDFNYDNQTITINNFGGACGSTYDTYKYNSSDHKCVLIQSSREEYDGSTDKCITQTFEIIPQSEQLISSK